MFELIAYKANDIKRITDYSPVNRMQNIPFFKSMVPAGEEMSNVQIPIPNERFESILKNSIFGFLEPVSYDESQLSKKANILWTCRAH